MKLNISKGAHVNYLAKIVYVDKFTPHPNSEYTKTFRMDMTMGVFLPKHLMIIMKELTSRLLCIVLLRLMLMERFMNIVHVKFSSSVKAAVSKL